MKGLLTGPLRSGLYEVGDVVGVGAKLRRAGWHVGYVDLSDGRAAVAVLGEELGFPDWYGRNLDALADSLTDLTVPTALVAVGGGAVDDYSLELGRILLDRTKAPGVPFALVVGAVPL
jgi:hypothetical protein